jgi:hypothetical protein
MHRLLLCPEAEMTRCLIVFEYRFLEMYDCRHDCTTVLAEVHVGGFGVYRYT